MIKLHHNAKNLAGQRFERLTALRPIKKRANSGQIVWECICDCGKQHFVRSDSLRDGSVKSCGCLQKEIAKRHNTQHKMAKTSIYKRWQQMIQRCENPKDPSYKNYGGRGILVCERWNEFKRFLEDMGERPAGLTLDRENNDGNYEPKNCRWATRKEQNQNKRNNVKHI